MDYPRHEADDRKYDVQEEMERETHLQEHADRRQYDR
jgi:hypothetical protein